MTTLIVNFHAFDKSTISEIFENASYIPNVGEYIQEESTGYYEISIKKVILEKADATILIEAYKLP